MDARFAVQIVSLSLSFGALCAMALLIRRYPHRWGYSVLPVLWLLHNVVFYAILVAFRMTPDYVLTEYNATWASIINLQAVLTLILVSVSIWIWWDRHE